MLGTEAIILVSDVGISVPLHHGYIDWVEDPDEPFAIDVPGYGSTRRSTHRSGEVFRLPGGHRVALSLALDAARRLPPGCAIRASVWRVSPDTRFGHEPILHLEGEQYRYGAPLRCERDANLVVDSPGRYEIDMELVRWNVAEHEFSSVPIDVEPREFEVRTDTGCTLVTVGSRFVDTPR